MPRLRPRSPLDRAAREAAEAALLSPGATRAEGAGRRARPEAPDTHRTCFERDRDRILHAPAFRRLAGKTQVFIFPTDHQRTRLTHAHEVAQVAGAIATAVGLNVALTTAIALGHDCGHGPGGHASEDALALYLPDGFEHGPWGADETLASLNLCAETLDGIRNHSWSRPAPSTPEALVVRWADRIAYCCHDLEDAVAAGIVQLGDLPRDLGELLGDARGDQLRAFIQGAIDAISTTGEIVLGAELAEALAELRRFNHERIYLRPVSLEQGRAVTRVLQALVEHVAASPHVLPPDAARGLAPGSSAALHAAVRWVAGMTDRYACDRAVELLGWPSDELPRGLGVR
jgi:dGTPase